MGHRLLQGIAAGLRWGLRYPLGRTQWVIFALWVLVLAGGSVAIGDMIATTTNLDPNVCDQGAYLRIAEGSRETPWPATTDGVRNPLFPWLLAKIFGDQPDAIFANGRSLNVRLGALLIVALGCWAGLRFAWLPAMTFATIAPAVLLPLSTYAGAEVLFYGLTFATWMQALALYEKLTLPRCALFGATLAAAYLAKPGITFMSACFALVGVALWIGMRRSTDPRGWVGWRPVGGAALAIAVAGLMITPRCLDAWKKFGDPLQNTAQRCFWADSWDECFPVGSLLNRRFIDQIPPADRPTRARFFARHGWTGAWDRLIRGFFIQVDNVFAPDRRSIWFGRQPSEKRPVRRIFPYRGFFLLPPLAAVIGLWLAGRRKFGASVMSPAAPWQASFVLLFVTVTVVAFSWYAAIAPGARFVVALYLPVLASLIAVAETLRRRLSARWSDLAVAGAWLVMLAAITAHLSLIATHPYFDKLKGAF